MNEDTIDIILPTYHPNLNLLKRAIESIIKQQYTNWVLYLIQDGNECDVLSLANSFNDSRICYLEIPHSGKPAALNYAIKKGNSKYIAYQDDDDIWYPNHLSECLTYMKNNNCKFVHSDAHEVFITVTNDNEYKETSRQKLHRGLITDLTLYYISHINVLHERELLNKAGGYDEAMQFYIDWDMFQRLAHHAKPDHLPVYTCEHYIFTNKDGANINTISSVHAKNLLLHQEKTKLMFKKSFELLTVDNYFDILEDLQKNEYLTRQIELYKDELNQMKVELNQMKVELNQIYVSKTWLITKPLRFMSKLFKI